MMNVGIAVAIAIVTFVLAALGGHVATQNWKLRSTFWFLGLIGVVLVVWQAWHTQQEDNRHDVESKAQSAKLDFVQKQDAEILAQLRGSDNGDRSQAASAPTRKPQNSSASLARTPPSPVHTTDAETRRRRQILAALRNEFILSHDGISSAMLAGLEWPPPEWVNKRLNELGEKWKVKEGATPAEVEVTEAPF